MGGFIPLKFERVHKQGHTLVQMGKTQTWRMCTFSPSTFCKAQVVILWTGAVRATHYSDFFCNNYSLLTVIILLGTAHGCGTW